MSTYSKCNGLRCPVRMRCMRYRAPTDEVGQSWVAPQSGRGESCDNWFPIEHACADCGERFDSLDPSRARCLPCHERHRRRYC